MKQREKSERERGRGLPKNGMPLLGLEPPSLKTSLMGQIFGAQKTKYLMMKEERNRTYKQTNKDKEMKDKTIRKKGYLEKWVRQVGWSCYYFLEGAFFSSSLLLGRCSQREYMMFRYRCTSYE